jgi:hypothetical protein
MLVLARRVEHALDVAVNGSRCFYHRRPVMSGRERKRCRRAPRHGSPKKSKASDRSETLEPRGVHLPATAFANSEDICSD